MNSFWQGEFLDMPKLAALVKSKRKRDKLSLRGAASVTLISPSTLSRIERQGAAPDVDTFVALTAWLAVPMDVLIKGKTKPRTGSDLAGDVLLAINGRLSKAQEDVVLQMIDIFIGG